ncbi:EAL domain-containing protein [Sulfuriferula sp. GW1]|uniref:EAL domain-containing protein n=1 Tax=Sulfuriferula sp. GW1 TaxID=3345111 RepID=UPI0039AF37CF
MTLPDSRLVPNATWLAGIFAGLIALAFPLLYFSLSYQYQSASMQTEVEFNAANITHLINANPELWQFEEHRLVSLLTDQASTTLPESRRIVDTKGRLIAQSQEKLIPPYLSRSADLLDSGSIVGRVEVIRSLSPLLLDTAMAGLLGLLLGGVTFMVFRTYPVRALKRALNTLANEKERAEVTLHSIGDAVITTNANGCIEYLNPVAEQLTGWSNAAAHGQPSSQVFNIINENTGELLDNPAEKAVRENRIVPATNHAGLIKRNGKIIPIEDSAAPICNSHGQIIGAVLVFHDVSHARAMAIKLSHQASHDALTGLLNRHAFETRLQQVLENAARENSYHTLCYMDLDQFKIVNDTCGHTAGDELLRQLSAELRAQVRGSDILARLGGDEFGLLLEGCSMNMSDIIVGKLLQAVRDFRFNWQEQTFSVGVSIGVVSVHAKCGGLMEIMRAADSACYTAKDRGRNRIYVYQPDDHEVALRRSEMQWVSRITKAIDEDRFRLYFQTIRPIISGAQGAHYEILLRMLDEDGKIISPASFIPAAERYGLMPAIDRWVIQNTFAKLGRLYRGGTKQLLHTCSINLSGTSWANEDLVGFICEMAAQYRVPARVICFELTETAAITHLSKAIAFIRELKSVGFRFSLDDFGSGVSSFGYLKQLPVDYLKIDGGFVRNMIDDKIDLAMVETINNIGHIMGIKTIAEFVENEAILEKLTHMGVDNAQGYAIAKPLPLDDIIVGAPAVTLPQELSASLMAVH